MKHEHTAEEKRAYFQGLRDRWTANKAAANADNSARELYERVAAESPSGRVSFYSFYFTLSDMRKQGLDGLPYIDAKTFKSWRDAGFMVRKGEHSTLEGITWLEVGAGKGEDKEDGDGYLMPKAYALFHRSQVDAITA